MTTLLKCLFAIGNNVDDDDDDVIWPFSNKMLKAKSRILYTVFGFYNALVWCFCVSEKAHSHIHKHTLKYLISLCEFNSIMCHCNVHYKQNNSLDFVQLLFNYYSNFPGILRLNARTIYSSE